MRGRTHGPASHRVLVRGDRGRDDRGAWLAPPVTPSATSGPRRLDRLPLIESDDPNDVVFMAIAVFFLYSFPERLQRGDLLASCTDSGSLAHIIGHAPAGPRTPSTCGGLLPEPTQRMTTTSTAHLRWSGTSTTAQAAPAWSARPRPCAPRSPR